MTVSPAPQPTRPAPTGAGPPPADPVPTTPVPAAAAAAPASGSGSASSDTTTAAAGRTRRLLGVDGTRGVALIGMMAVHALPVSDPAGHPTWVGRVAEGPAAATFALLAGVGIALMTGRRRVRFWSEGAGTAAMLVARALVVGLIGLGLGEVADPQYGAVILPYYAVLFLLAIPLVFVPTRTLLALGALLAVALPALDHVLLPGLPPPLVENPGFGSLVADPGRLLATLTLTGYYPAVIWTVYLCAGIGLGRLRLSSPRVARGLVLVGVPLAVISRVVSSVLLSKYGGLAAIQTSAAATHLSPATLNEDVVLGPDGVTPPGTWWWEALVSGHSSTPLDLADTVGIGMALLGLMLLLGHVRMPGLRGLITLLRLPLVAAGSLTLTLYSAHILFMNSDADVYDPGTGFAVQVIGALVLGTFWWATAGKGPLETLTAAVSHRAKRWVTRSS